MSRFEEVSFLNDESNLPWYRNTKVVTYGGIAVFIVIVIIISAILIAVNGLGVTVNYLTIQQHQNVSIYYPLDFHDNYKWYGISNEEANNYVDYQYIDGWGSSNLEINIQCHTNYNSSFCNNNRDPTILVTLTAGNCQTVYYEEITQTYVNLCYSNTKCSDCKKSVQDSACYC